MALNEEKTSCDDNSLDCKTSYLSKGIIQVSNCTPNSKPDWLRELGLIFDRQSRYKDFKSSYQK